MKTDGGPFAPASSMAAISSEVSSAGIQADQRSESKLVWDIGHSLTKIRYVEILVESVYLCCRPVVNL